VILAIDSLFTTSTEKTGVIWSCKLLMLVVFVASAALVFLL